MKHKTLLAGALALAIPAIGFSENPIPRYTADYYKVHAGEHLGEKVKVYAYAASLLDPFEHYHPDYFMVEVETTHNGQQGGSILVSVPAYEIGEFKEQYSKQGDYEEEERSIDLSILGIGPEVEIPDNVFEPPEVFAEELDGILQIGETEQGQKFLYIVYGDRDSDQRNEARVRKYLGTKITIQAHSAQPDPSGALDHIADAKAYLVKTSGEGIRSGRMTVAIPNDNLPYFKKNFLRKDESPQNLSGYLYEHQIATGSFLFLYCSTQPLESSTEATPKKLGQ